MKIILTVETIETGEYARTEIDCESYDQGFLTMQQSIKEGTRLLSVQVDR